MDGGDEVKTSKPRDSVHPDAERSERVVATEAQDEDEVAGVVGAVRRFQPFRNPEVRSR